MKVLQFILLLLININVMAQHRPAEIEVNALFEKLEEANYYWYVEDKELIGTAQKIIRESLLNHNGGLTFPDLAWVLREKNGESTPGEDRLFAYRGFYLGGDYLFRGDFAVYLEKVKQMFEARGLTLTYEDENMFWREEDRTDDFYYFKHDIVINDSLYIIAEGNLNLMGSNQYVTRFMEIISTELDKQGHEDKFVLMTNPDSVYILLINDVIRSIFENMPRSIPNRIVK